MIKYEWNCQKSLKDVVRALKQGKIFLCSTDTVIGLLASPSLKSVEKLNAIKGRENKPYILLVPNLSYVERIVEPNIFIHLESFLKKCWPGPVTIIFNTLPDNMTAPCIIQGNETVAIRIADHTGLGKLLLHFPGLLSTSANKHGQPAPYLFQDIDPALVSNVYGLISQEAVVPSKQASTLLDATQIPIRVVREGAYSIAALEKLYGSPFLK